MELAGFGMGLGFLWWIVGMLVQFAIIYGAVRLALRHERPYR
ncbi:hypothetical protein [Spongiactinospora sp. 9N601]